VRRLAAVQEVAQELSLRAQDLPEYQRRCMLGREVRPSMSRILLSLIILIIPGVAASESMRCGKWIVNEDTSPDEIAAKCGEPQEKEVKTEDVLGINALGNPIKLGVSTTERWYYKRSPGSLTMVVTVLDGKTKTIERAE
ncbi:MAG: DUF2845 domain-containing protein, partial [Steroidobacteraceae bacterium]